MGRPGSEFTLAEFHLREVGPPLQWAAVPFANASRLSLQPQQIVQKKDIALAATAMDDHPRCRPQPFAFVAATDWRFGEPRQIPICYPAPMYIANSAI
jgi:hypothetical protein